MEIQEVDAKVLTIIEEGDAVIITSMLSYVKAGELWTFITKMKKEVDASYDPIIQKAHQAHKEALNQKAKIFDPLKRAGRYVKASMERYDDDQEQIRLKEEARLREIARKEEEERQLAEALEAEQNGEKEEAEAIIEEPVYTPPVVVQKTTPKLKDGPIYRTIWKHRVVNPHALFRAVAKGDIPMIAMIPNDVFLGQQAKSLKGQFNIPGVEAYSERV